MRRIVRLVKVLSIFLIGLFIAPVYSSHITINLLSPQDGIYSQFRHSIADNAFLIRRYQQNSYAYLDRGISIPRLEYAQYCIREGDSVFNIASRLGLDPDTIISVNNIPSMEAVQKDMNIIIPNMRGTFWKAESITTLEEVATSLHVSPQLLQSVNQLERQEIYLGEELFIPGGKLSQNEWAYFNHRTFIPPLDGELRVTSEMGWREDPFTHRRTYHGGVDLGAPTGTPVRAAQSGEVVHAGWGGGYGKLIIIAHQYNYKTYYGHLSRIRVRNGDRITRGQIIGNVGSTGRSTGPHLHFEMRRFNHRKNPMELTHFDHR